MRPTALSISVISKRSTDLSPPFLVLPPLSIRFARCRVSRAFAALCSASITLGNEGYLAPYTVIFRFTMIPSTNVFRLVRLASSNLCHSKFSTLHIINRTREFFSADTFFYTSPLVSRVFPALFANEMNFLMQLFVLKFMDNMSLSRYSFFLLKQFCVQTLDQEKTKFPYPCIFILFFFFFLEKTS